MPVAFAMFVVVDRVVGGLVRTTGLVIAIDLLKMTMDVHGQPMTVRTAFDNNHKIDHQGSMRRSSRIGDQQELS